MALSDCVEGSRKHIKEKTCQTYRILCYTVKKWYKSCSGFCGSNTSIAGLLTGQTTDNRMYLGKKEDIPETNYLPFVSWISKVFTKSLNLLCTRYEESTLAKERDKLQSRSEKRRGLLPNSHGLRSINFLNFYKSTTKRRWTNLSGKF